ncbi:flavin-containing monooxygenase [Rhodococcus sp. 27YEA15]|uniref:flavin-containing monooxygenase n=1 Tax=Rhodococcus sp. 27YEA15 TaxID=3156259 RepID=UPI003C7AB5C0
MSGRSAREIATTWIERFRDAMVAGDGDAAADLIDPDGAWRDVLALTWDLHTYYGDVQVRAGLSSSLPLVQVTALELDESVPPRLVARGGISAIEALFTMDTADGRARGVVRLVPTSESADAPARALNVMTSLQELSGYPDSRRLESDHSKRFGGTNWLDRRISSVEYEDREPAVVIVGGGQAGIALAARLGQQGVDTLVVDRMDRVGDNWRNRYHSLTLHNEVWVNHLPFIPFPDTWPTYVPKDKLAGWFEAYVESLEINFWTGTEFTGGSYDAAEQRWTVTVERRGVKRTLRPRHVVLATGVSGIPNLPAVPGLDGFAGDVVHSGRFTDGTGYAGKHVVVLGSGNSGHDVAQELHACGARVTMVQRSATTVVSVGPDAAGRVYSLYGEGPSTEDCDLITVSVPYPLLRRSYQHVTKKLAELDAPLIQSLESAGFRVDYGSDGTGFQMKYLRRGGGYYLDVGCSSLIAGKEIALLQNSDIERFAPTGIRLTDGSELAADAVILATGYKPQQELVRSLFGDDVADRVGPVWGYDEEGELRNMWKRTDQDGLWFTAGSLAQCRIYSKFLALQIKACEIGRISVSRDETIPRGEIRASDIDDVAGALVPQATAV